MSEAKSTSTMRRFPVEPIETSTVSRRSARKNPADSSAKEDKSTVRRFLPQPVETSSRRSRKPKAQTLRDSDSDDGEAQIAAKARSRPNGQKQYPPQLIETAKRSRKNGDQGTTLLQQDKTDSSPGDKTYQPRHVRLAKPLPTKTVHDTCDDADKPLQPPESRFSYASLSVKSEARRRSFRVPALESITSGGDSDDSAEDNIPSLSTTPSAISEEPEKQEKQTKLRRIHTESHDGNDKNLSNYILSLAATAAKKQLHEQALAAFPNERDHQRVDHFAIEDEDTVYDGERDAFLDDPDYYQRKMSSAAWELLETQKHKEMLEEQRRRQKLQGEKPVEKGPEFDPWHNPYEFSVLKVTRRRTDQETNLSGPLRDSEEVSKMRNAASPPMLGVDLIFPKSQSPQHTMMDPTQRPRSRKLDRHGGSESRQNSGLWTTNSISPTLTRKSSTSGRHLSRNTSSTGLWTGVCQSPEHHSNIPSCLSKLKAQSGLTTPDNEKADPFSPAPTPILTPCYQLPVTPNLVPETGNHLEGIDSVLQLEATIDEEYPDSFVTQVYNYLSLGYPALARDYDGELSKISRVPIEDIRRGDDKIDSRGHIGTPEGEGWDESRCMEECGRWTALRLYIREWARQQPKFIEEAHNGKNARGRRGSWGV
ncbi:MAG: hypothetical protein GOMPHAMPRED_002580 [Gomphillus americanus]|uniref:Uncharacterized protein n=1 Tax=Gomphillus americanus TaxID=1940652 RepID=A0A8H3IIV6_9LECA|nr:MAG: hypothetical protein GOMPHAMPRED_002580 [Gomphillus americanus]